jgi:hypothetical protein
MNAFKWTRKREKAAMALAEGYPERQSAEIARVARSTIQRWKNNVEFMAEVDRLSLMVGIASRGERLRIASKAVRAKIQDEGNMVLTGKDVLDWLKFAQSETDGAKLDLASIFEAMEATAKDAGNATDSSTDS